MIRNRKLFFRCGLLIGSLFFMIGLATPAAAQSYVEGVSAILSSTNASEIDTFSETYLTPDIAYYYGAYVEGFLFQNGTQIAFGYADRYPYENDAYGVLSRPLIVGDTYTIESDHYLVAYYIYGYDDYGNPEYWNPENFLIATGGSPEPSGFSFLPGGGPVFYEVEYLYLGTTGVQISAAAPRIDEIGPNTGVLGSSGSINVHGENLVDIFTGDTMPVITGSGVSVAVDQQNPPDSTLVVLDYTISNSASTGAQSLTLATRFGTSNPKTFTVADRTPNITSINPDRWIADTTTSFTINGTGFGTNPTLNVSGQGVRSYTISPGATDTQIQASVTLDPNAPDGTGTVTVTSNGRVGTGFIATDPGQSRTTSANTNIQAIDPPQPRILLNETQVDRTVHTTDITGTMQTVVVGQQIALTTQVPAGISKLEEMWLNPPGKTVGGFNVIDTATVSKGNRVELPSLHSSGLTFYWVDSGDSRQVTYEYTASNGRSNRATATFNVKGLGGSPLMTPTTRTDGSGVQLTTNGSKVFLEKTGVSVPGVLFPVGISFQSNATPPSGYNQSFTWVQILNNVQIKSIAETGVSPEAPESGLDTFYPYGNATPTTTNDTPGSELLVSDGEFWQTFSATMYLMWDPALPNGCAPASTDQKARKSKESTCTSIPIPLSSVTWHWSGCAINTLSTQTGVNGTTWILSRERECPKEPIGTVQLSDFPQWTIKVVP